MSGQHIFMRCRNEQKNAGTWTAAITPGIVDSTVLRNQIEPKCVIEERFAQNTLVNCPSNNVLRIYHIQDKTIVTRTSWEKDTITEREGRRGAFCRGYICDRRDTMLFNSDFAGAFDPACFESYEAVAARTNAHPEGKVTINESMDLFRHGTIESGQDVFRRCGFGCEEFILLMNGLYQAIRAKKSLAVILPGNVRKQWEEYGDNTAEKLAYSILRLFPDFVRINIGLASHWSCDLGTNMTSGMSLVFVHPGTPEDIAELRRTAGLILDLDERKSSSEIEKSARYYFAFLWESQENYEAIEEFWRYAKGNYKPLLKERSLDQKLMEAIYLIYFCQTQENCPEEIRRDALYTVAEQMSGFGGLSEDFDGFVLKLFRGLRFSGETLSREDEVTLRHLLETRNDPLYTKEVYAVLLDACEAGRIDKDTIKTMSHAAARQNPEVSLLLIERMESWEQKEQAEITPAMALFVPTLFVIAGTGEHAVRDYELIRRISACMYAWARRFYVSGNKENIGYYYSAYAKYLENGAAEALTVENAYEIITGLAVSPNRTISDECGRIILAEERGIYKDVRKLASGASRLPKLKEAVFGSLKGATDLESPCVQKAMESAFRLVFFDRASELGGFEELYLDLIKKDYVPVMQCQVRVLEELGTTNIWKKDRVGQVLNRLEMVMLQDMPTYRPTPEHFREYLNWVEAGSGVEFYHTLYQMLSRVLPSNRTAYFEAMQERNLLSGALGYFFFEENGEDLFRDGCLFVGARFREVLQSVLSAQGSCPLSGKPEAKERYEKWFRETLELDLITIAEQTERTAVTETQVRYLIGLSSVIMNQAGVSADYRYSSLGIVQEAMNKSMTAGAGDDYIRFSPESLDMVRNYYSKYMEAHPLHENLMILTATDNAVRDKEYDMLSAQVSRAGENDQRKKLICGRIRYLLEGGKVQLKVTEELLIRVFPACLMKQDSVAFGFSRYRNAKTSDQLQLIIYMMEYFATHESAVRQDALRIGFRQLQVLSEEDPKAFHDDMIWRKYSRLIRTPGVREVGYYPNEFDNVRSRGQSITVPMILVSVFVPAVMQVLAWVVLHKVL